MRKAIVIFGFYYLFISFVLLFYTFDNGKSINVLMKALYFTKDDIVIIGLLLFCISYFERKYRPIFWTVFTYSAMCFIYDIALVCSNNTKYSEAVQSENWSVVFALLMLATFTVSYSIYGDNNG